MSNTNGGDPQPTVLVVDDDRETAELYTEILADEYNVRTAYSGEKALDVVDEDVAVMLLDRDMPGISGDEVLETIRARNLGCRVVMITGIQPDITVLDLPFDEYLVKPVSRERLRTVVAEMLIRNTCDARIRDVVALVSRMATLESKLSIDELAASSEYAAAEDQFDTLRAAADLGKPTDDIYAQFTAEKVRALFNGREAHSPVK